VRLPPDARLRADVGRLLEAAGESSAAEVLDPILIHLRLLARWNDAYGLTRITEWPEILERHVRESLLPLRWIARDLPGRMLDVGTGNGFPALPILACRPGLAGVLLERSERKGLFLDAVVREARWGGRVEIDPTDAEKYEPGSSPSPPPGHRGKTGRKPGPMSAADTRVGDKGEQMSAADNWKREVLHGGGGEVRDPAAQAVTSPAESPHWAPGLSAGPDRGGQADSAPQSLVQGAAENPLFEYVGSRATLSPERYLELASRWVRPGGRVFLFASDVGRRFVAGEGACAFTRLERLRIPGRRASFLYIFDAASR
jgi:16S rRNA G527 N7-methylase RsmG